MGEFPIYQSSRSLPGEGPSVRGNVDTRTGAAAIGAGLSDLGASAAESGHTMFRIQGETELVDAMAQDENDFNEFAIGLKGNSDPESYQREFDQMWKSKIETREVKNGWAKRRRMLSLAKLKPAWAGQVQEESYKRVRENHAQAVASATAKATETGNVGPVRALLQTEVDKGWITQDGMDAALASVEHDAQRRQVETVALSDTPDLVLQYETYEELKEDYPKLTPGDFQDLRATAMGQKGSLKNEYGKWWDSVVNDTLGKAQNMDPSEFRSQLIQTPGLTEEQRTELMETYLKAAKLWQDEGRSPYSVTQNEASLVQAYIGIEDGSITSLDELNKLYLEGKRVNWSTEDMLRVKNAFYASQGIKSGDAALYAEHATQEAIDRLRPLYFDEKGNFKDPTPERHTQYLHDRMATIEAIKQNPDSIVKRNAAVEEAQKPSRQKAARSWLVSLAGKGVAPAPQLWWMGAKAVGGAYKNLLSGEDVPTPKTQAEYDALPTGSRFIDKKDGQIYVKK